MPLSRPSLRSHRSLLLAFWFAAAPLAAQQIAAPVPRFEVATVRPTDTRRPFAVDIQNDGDLVIIHGFTLPMLVMTAFDVQPFQIAGGPGWAATERFDIRAKVPAPVPTVSQGEFPARSPLTDPERRMLLQLLTDRFQLRCHRGERQGTVYLLEPGKGKLLLQPPRDPRLPPWLGGVEGGAISRPTGIAGRNISMPEFAQRLSRYLRRPVIDRTGLPGSYDFEYRIAEDDPGANRISAILTSVRALGLDLKSAQGPIDTIVIDSAAPPSDN